MKQVIVVNDGLKLPRGKLAAQVAHASVGAFIEADEDAKSAWVENGMPKVVLKGESEGVLWNLLDSARRRNIPAWLKTLARLSCLPGQSLVWASVRPG